MHRNVVLLVLIILLMAAAWIHFRAMPIVSVNTDVIDNSESPKPIVKSDLKVTTFPSKTTTSENTDLPIEIVIEGTSVENWLAEIDDYVYSKDPVIEAATLSNDFRKCRYSWRLNHANKVAESVIKKLTQQIEQKCQDYALKYPLWFHAKDRDQAILSLPTDSLYGEQYKYILGGYYNQHQDLYYDQLIQARIEFSLTVKSPSMISFGALDHSVGLVGPEDQTAFYQELLQTKVGFWIYQALQLAMQSLSCDLPNSQSCEASSFYMLYQCQYDDTACGLSFQQWYQDHTSAGMKQDVLILINHLKDRYP